MFEKRSAESLQISLMFSLSLVGPTLLAEHDRQLATLLVWPPAHREEQFQLRDIPIRSALLSSISGSRSSVLAQSLMR
jgi:hypothetical protein